MISWLFKRKEEAADFDDGYLIEPYVTADGVPTYRLMWRGLVDIDTFEARVVAVNQDRAMLEHGLRHIRGQS